MSHLNWCLESGGESEFEFSLVGPVLSNATGQPIHQGNLDLAFLSNQDRNVTIDERGQLPL